MVGDSSARPATPEPTLPANLIAFGRALRARKVDVTAGRLIDTARCLRLVELTDREQFYHALRSNLVSSPRDGAVFDELFQAFWPLGLPAGDPLWLRGPGGDASEQRVQKADVPTQLAELGLEEWETGDAEHAAEEERDLPGYSSSELLFVKDFSTFTSSEMQEIGRIVVLLGRKLATRLSRRTRPSHRHGSVDLRRSLRANLRFGGDAVRLLRREPKPGKTRIVVLCDVSGSMDLYSRFLVQFLYALQSRLSNVETFVFGTRLTRISPILRHRSLRQALFRIAQVARDWSGGTNIGGCLQQFNQVYGPTILGPRTLIVMMSDGWDRGDSGLLEREMQRLRLSSHKIIWLNPLLGNANYQPLCKGISVSLPYVDCFLPVHNVASLAQVGQTLISLAS